MALYWPYCTQYVSEVINHSRTPICRNFIKGSDISSVDVIRLNLICQLAHKVLLAKSNTVRFENKA